MIWSISGSKLFKTCPRQWYYKNIVADGRVKNDPYRREVTILSKLQSLEAFRGKIVDDIISRKVINTINRKYTLKKDYFIKEALTAFENQLLFARLQNYREEGFKLSGDENFAALFDYEFKGSISVKDLEDAKADIVEAISNFIDNKELIEYLKSASFLMSQRPLTYSFNKFTIKGIPDLVAFFESSAPHIFDWKVHTYGLNTYDEQLVAYAYALNYVSSTKPHIDFPKNLGDYAIAEYKLSEYQLLHKERLKRDYILTEERVEEFKDYMSSSIIEIFMAGGTKKYGEVDELNFDTTYYPETCETCSFKNLCNKSAI